MAESEPPFVSICLLTYKRAKLLPRSLDSLLAQTHRNFELIINDDNSPDETAEVCRAYEKRDPRVRYCRNAVNLRYAGNQNAAIERARAEYVAIVHDGDVYRADLIEQWVRALVRFPSAGLVFNASNSIDESGRIIGTHRHPYGDLVRGGELLDQMLQQSGSPIYGIAMVRRAAVLEAGPFDLRLPTLADVDMWMRILLRRDAAYIAEPLLSISPREANHHNRTGNWAVLAQQELIYRLNFSRRYPERTRVSERVLANCRKVQRNVRFRWLATCLRRGQWKDFFAGLRYCLKPALPTPWDVSGLLPDE